MSLRLGIDVETSELTRYMGRLRTKSLAFAAVNGINATVKRVQEEARRNIEREFTVRAATRQFVLREGAKIMQFASTRQPTPFAELGVNNRPRFLLGEFERGAQRRPFTPGAKSVARPLAGSAARPTFGSTVPAALRFKALQLRPQLDSLQRKELRSIKGADRKETAALRAARRSELGRGRVWKGKQRTYAVPGVGVFQRTGPKTSELLYVYDSDIRLPPRLRFVASAREKAPAWLRQETRKALAAEIREARRRGRL